MNPTFETAKPLKRSTATRPAKRPILVVDDVPTTCQMLSGLLTEEGYMVLAAANCREALEVVNAIKLDLVLLDLNTPLEDEWEAFGRLAAQNSVLPILLITDKPDQFFHALASGISALLEMPLNFTRISERIDSLLWNSRKGVWRVSMSTF